MQDSRNFEQFYFTSKLFTFASILTDRIGAIEWLRDRPSHQIPNSAMIVQVARA
ncbi:MAG: hypothetical protein WBL95_22670 [Microcoleus sp.]